MLSTRVRTLPGRTTAHAWWTTLLKFSYGGRGVIHVSDPDWHLIPNMLNWVHVWTPSWPVHDLNILLVQKGCRVTCCMGRGIVLDVHKVTSKHPRRPWQKLIPRDLDVPMPVHDSIHHDQLTPPPYHDWRATIPIIGWTQASISLSPCLRHTRTRPSLWYRENRDSSLKIQCLHFLKSHTLFLLSYSRRCRLCSKVSLGHLAGRRDQYPVARSRLQMVRTDIRLPNRRIICIHRRGAEMKQFVLTIRSSWRSFRGVEIFIIPPRLLWCGWPVSRWHCKILLMEPWDAPSILATSRWELPSADNLTICCSICPSKLCGMIPFKSSKKYR